MRALEELGQYGLMQRCERYGVGTRCRAGRGGERAIALDPACVAELLAAPADEPAPGGPGGHAA
jgi:hypothetical protein